MEADSLCEYCHEKLAVASCEVCGAAVCDDHKLGYGCEVCGGGERKLD